MKFPIRNPFRKKEDATVRLEREIHHALEHNKKEARKMLLKFLEEMIHEVDLYTTEANGTERLLQFSDIQKMDNKNLRDLYELIIAETRK